MRKDMKRRGYEKLMGFEINWCYFEEIENLGFSELLVLNF